MSDDGRLYGEIPLGYYRVRRAIERLDGFPPELEQAVLHIILSHHGTLEHGSPVVPCTREATLVHMIDNLGGRLGSFDRLEKELLDGEQWSAYDKGDRRRRLLRRRRTAPAPGRVSAEQPEHDALRSKCAQIASPTSRSARPSLGARTTVEEAMAKDTEKLIRQLSLISYLMAERRPVTAPEIRRDVEGYSVMNEDAFARRFYADRSELEALGIVLAVEKPVDGLVEQENYSLPPENFHLPPIEFTDKELAALRTALQLLDGEFAYAEPLRLALQQISWGRPSPLSAPEQRTVALGITGSAGGHEVSQRLAKIETAIFRRKTIVFDYYTMERDEVGARRVDPYQLLYQGGQFYVVGRSHERDAIRVFRLSRIRGKVGYATKAEHDFQRPADFDPRAYANRIDWQFGEPIGTRRDLDRQRIAWQIERHFGRYGEIRPTARTSGDRLFVTQYANARQLIAWVLGLGENARIARPARARRASCASGVGLLIERHTGEPRDRRRRPTPRAPSADAADRGRATASRRAANGHQPRRRDPPRAVRPAGDAREHPDRGRPRRRAARAPTTCCRELKVSDAGAARGHLGAQRRQLRRRHLRPVRRDPRGRHDRGRPRALRRLVRPAGAAAAGRGQGAVAAIDLIGEHIPEGSLASVRRQGRRRARRGPGPRGLQFAHPGGDDAEIAAVVSRAIASRRLLSFEYYKENEDEFTTRDWSSPTR